ncbi:MAG: hypothetical protein ABEJ83_02310 [Candidatus Nanohaloarchaea archaeon]
MLSFSFISSLVLSENSEKDHFWLEDKLFNFGYRSGPKERKSLSRRRRERERPYLPHGWDMMPDLKFTLPENPVREGRKKREGDEYYIMADRQIGLEIADFDIEVI